MKRRSFMQISLGAGAALATQAALAASTAQTAAADAAPAVASPSTAAPLVWVSRRLNAMGLSMQLQLGHRDRQFGEQALQAAIAEIRAVEDQMSLFRADSALCQLNREGRLDHAPADLLAVLRLAQQVSAHSQGSFDVTVQPLWLAFEQARQQARLPTPVEVAQARARVGWRGLLLEGDSLRLQRSGMAVTLNGIAQGYAADKVHARWQAMGIEHALVDAGEWAAMGQSPHGGDWNLGLASPRGAHALLAGVSLHGKCLATSADDQCHFSDDLVHHHIFDPRTGYSPGGIASVSVMADSAAMADALTKVLFMAGYPRALPLARSLGVAALVVDKQGRWQATADMPLRQASLLRG